LLTKLNLRIKDIASGTSQDWAYGVAKILHSYTIELRPDINDIYTGFLLDESYVLEVGEEMYQGILTYKLEMINLIHVLKFDQIKIYI
jgi:hypothetical protein